MNVNIINIKI